MSENGNFGYGYDAQALQEGREAAFDASAMMTKVFGWMTAALAITAVVAMFTATNGQMRQMVLGTPGVFIALLVVELILVLAIPAAVSRSGIL